MTDPAPFGTYAPAGAVAWLLARTCAQPAGRWRARRIALALRRVAIGLLGGEPLDVERFGARMRLHPYNNVSEKKVLFTPQFFDPAERAILAERLPPDAIFIDVGANFGAYSLAVAAGCGRRARVVAVEPQPDLFDRLVYNIGQNPFGTVKAVACAIADKAGELTLFIDARNRGESSLKIVGTNRGAAIRVPAMTLLDLVRSEGFSRIDAIKLDVEGAEDLVLEPFLRTAPPALYPHLVILEDGIGHWAVDLPGLLTQKGYRLIHRTRLNLVYERGTGGVAPGQTQAP